MKIKLISCTNKKPLELISFSARVCYSSKKPKWGKLLDVENILWPAGHHTPFEHFFVSFLIEEIPVGEVTLGLHLIHPFYNTSQRSGRYSAKMFYQPNWRKIENYISNFWPEIRKEDRKEIMNYVKEGVSLFQENHFKITELARKFLKKERPFISKENLERNAPKIAQEQLRMFIPVIFPTALVYTINLVTLAALQRVAWTPIMREVVEEMIKAVLKKFPELSFVYQWDEKNNQDWWPELKSKQIRILKEPRLKLLEIKKLSDAVFPSEEKISPLDLLHFLPETMTNYFVRITTQVEISLATMGQDQRHRTLERSLPEFTGNFYLPPLLQEAGLEQKAKKIFQNWLSFKKKIPDTLWTILAPYGTMVRYKKTGSLNAIIHEQNKRLCWRAQEEIYWLSCLLREEIKKTKHKELLKILEPPCFSGRCPEGNQYCGRDLRKTKEFLRRKV